MLSKTVQLKYLASNIIMRHRFSDSNSMDKMEKQLNGVLYDKRILIRSTSMEEFTKRPVMLYGAECWATTATIEQKRHADEMKIRHTLLNIISKTTT